MKKLVSVCLMSYKGVLKINKNSVNAKEQWGFSVPWQKRK
jgi:hypothetical protein